MRKVLLATTALATVAGVAAVANADVSISGSSEMRYYSISDDNSSRSSDADFSSKNDITIAFSTTTDNGMTLSMTQNLSDGGAGTRTTSISDDFGTITFTDTSSSHASSTFKVTSPGMGGGHGDIATSVTEKTSGAAVTGVQEDEAQISDAAGDGGSFAYYSPNISGFTFGVSAGHLSSSDADTSMSMGAKYTGSMGDVSYTVGYGQYDGTSDDDGTMIGVNATWGDITVGMGAASNNDSSGNEEDTKSYGVTYVVSDAVKVNLGMTDSENDNGKEMKNTSFGVSYTIAPGLTASLATHNFEYSDSSDATQDNEGTITQAEIQVAF